MKKIKPIVYATVATAGLFLGSCTLAHTVAVTNNPVGSKRGEMASGTADVDSGVTYESAMKQGRITKVGIAEYKMKNYVFFVKEYMTVTGE
ncbi:MAG: hypothetical protein ACQERC_00765 [Bacteroidota bacterium]